MEDIGFIQNQNPLSVWGPEKVSIRHIKLDQYQAFYESRWRKVYLRYPKSNYIIYLGKKYNIDIEGV